MCERRRNLFRCATLAEGFLREIKSNQKLTLDSSGLALQFLGSHRPSHSTIGGLGVSTAVTTGVVDPCHNIKLKIERQAFQEQIVALV
jgi:hypothetical protein